MEKIVDKIEEAHKRSCAICKFVMVGEPNQQLQRELTCRRFPPQISMVVTPKGPMNFSLFPLVNRKQTCGEWQLALLGMADG